jgi:7,8-dihydroneopterin aldolase/epimerase/oxygenase
VQDSIQVRGIRAFGHLGVLPEERTLGQWFEVDLTVGVDLSKAAQSDRLGDTYDYCGAVKNIQDYIATTQVQLIESAVDAIAAIVLAADKVNQVTVRLTKLTPPVPHFSGTVSVEITRCQAANRLPVSANSQ